MIARHIATALALLLAASTNLVISPAQAQAPRPMTFLDMQQMRQVGAPTPSPDGKWLLYTLSTPDWKEAKRQTDIYLVSLQQGVASTRQMTFTKEKNETSPRWARDGSFFVFLSNREAPESASSRNQLYVMRPDGGEARRITDAKEGVSDFAFSDDGRWLAYRSGKSGEEQLYRLPGHGIDTATAEAAHQAPDRRAHLAVGARRQAHLLRHARHASTRTRRLRREKKFTVNIRNAETPVASLWALDLDAAHAPSASPRAAPTPWTTSRSRTTASGSASAACRQIATSAASRRRTSTPISICSKPRPASIERLTNNAEVGESGLSFSPDCQRIAFSAPDDLENYGMSNNRVYLRAIADRGKPFRKLGSTFDGDVTIGFWSKDGSTIYFNEGIKATNQIVVARRALQHGAAAHRGKGQRVDRARTTTPACC